jgi:hypothetical protein
MHKKSLVLITTLCLLSLLFGSFGSVQAAPLHDDPVVMVISGGAALETKVIPMEELPGTSVSDSGLSVPAFSTSGMSQFGGDGVRVKGLIGSVASVCFTAKPTSAGWTNTVHRWTGFTWEEVPTVVTTTEGGINPRACATIYYDGTYALLVGYVKPVVEKAAESLPECVDYQIYPGIDGSRTDQMIVYNLIVHNPLIDAGTEIEVSMINIQPFGMFTGDLSRDSFPSVNLTDFESGRTFSFFQFEDEGVFPSNANWRESSFTLRFTFPTCYVDWNYSDLFD